MGSWNMQEHWDSDLFWSGDGRICRVFPPLCVLYKSTHICHFFYCTQELHFLRRIFWAHSKSSNFEHLKVTRFSRKIPIPLLHPTTYCYSTDAMPKLEKRGSGKYIYMYIYILHSPIPIWINTIYNVCWPANLQIDQLHGWSIQLDDPNSFSTEICVQIFPFFPVSGHVNKTWYTNNQGADRF